MGQNKILPGDIYRHILDWQGTTQRWYSIVEHKVPTSRAYLVREAYELEDLLMYGGERSHRLEEEFHGDNCKLIRRRC